MVEELKLSATPKIRKKIDAVKRSLGFSKDEDALFFKYCMMLAYKPHASSSEKLRLAEEIKLIKKYLKDKKK
jgi:hypothetical protein